VHLLVNELCEYQNARGNDKKKTIPTIRLNLKRGTSYN